MWSGGGGALEQAESRQQLMLDVVWVVPGEIRKHYLQDELQYDRFEAGAYLNWSASVGLKNQARILLENGYSCCAPASLLVVFSEVLRKLISGQIPRELIASGKEITIRLNGIPSITNAGLYNVIAFMQNGQIKFLETELENILTAANDLRVFSLVSLICEEMTLRIQENTSCAIPLLYAVVACLPIHSQYRNMVVDSVAAKFHDVVTNPEFIKVSFEMLYALISSPVIQGPQWVMEIYKAVLFWLRNNTEFIYFAPALLDNINFKIASNTIENRREIIRKSTEIPELGPLVQIFLMDAIYSQFLDDLTAPSINNQSLSSSIYTVSGAETVNAPTPMGGMLSLEPSPLGSYIIPPFDSRSPVVTTKSVSDETSASVDKNWCSTQQPPIGSGFSHNPVGYQSNTANTVTCATDEKTLTKTGDSGRRLWSEVLVQGPKCGSKSKNITDQVSSLQTGTEPSSVLPPKSSQDSFRTVVTACGDLEHGNVVPSETEHNGLVGTDPVRGGPARNGRVDSGSAHRDQLCSESTAPIGPACTYSAVVAGTGIHKEGTATALATSPTSYSGEPRTSSSQESASSSKRRRKFEQIPLRTEPPKSRKELRKERQARERAGNK